MGRIFLFLITIRLFSAPLQVPVNAKAAIVMNAETGRVLFEKKGYELAYPASTTKIATLLYALIKKGDQLEQEVEVKSYTLSRMNQEMKEARNYRIPPYWLQPDGTSIHLQRGEKISFEALLYGLMLHSGNDAANVIADYVSGSISTFTRDLNLYLKKIGCTNTHFANPHGLHFPTHKTTAYDLAKMASCGLKHPTFRKVVLSKGYNCPKTNKSDVRELVQKNELIMDGRFHYEGALGIKRGTHSKAGYCLVAAAKYEGRTLVAVVLGCDDNKSRYRDVIALFDTAFAEKKVSRKLYNRDENLFSKQMKKHLIKARLKDDVSLSYFPAEEPDIQVKVKWKVDALPVYVGMKVGELQIRDNQKHVITTCDLLSESDIASPKNHLIWCLIFLPAPMVLLVWRKIHRKPIIPKLWK
ncbi:MAG: D-alanyl-D-alanine carboxypeptidase family protein [Candidatus Algichlamydia australiensis]|nr:D-alanyl-D-alanine carboxypeptidase family protein [Chlamydiales bacterium]